MNSSYLIEKAGTNNRGVFRVSIFLSALIAICLFLPSALYAAPVTTATPPGGLYNADQSVTLTTDIPATIFYTTDGSTPTISSTIFDGTPISLTSTTTLKFFAVDGADNAEAVKTEVYTIDKVAPIGSITINNGDTVVEQTTVTLTLSCADANGCSKMMISNDPAFTGAIEENFAANKAWTLSTGDGTKTVYAKFKDGAGTGNWSVVYTDTITLDTTMPYGDFIYNPSVSTRFIAGRGQLADCIYDINQDLVWSKNANLAGAMTWSSAIGWGSTINLCGYTDWRVPAIGELQGLISGWQGAPYTWLGSQGFINVQSSYYWSSSIYAGFPDYAWYVHMYYGSVAYYDMGSSYYVLPVRSGQSEAFGNLGISSGEAASQNLSVELLLSATHANGVELMQFSDNGTDWQIAVPYSTTHNYTLPASDGTKTVYVKFKAVGGNWSRAYSDSIELDTTAPTTTATPGTGYYSLTSVTLSANESGSTIYYTTDGIDPTTSSTVYSTPISISADTIIKFFAVDSVGNVEAIRTETYTIDNSLPTGSIKINNIDTITNSTAVTLTLTCNDTGSGCSQMMFKNESTGTWSAYEPFALTRAWTMATGDGIKTVYAKFKDAVGNESVSVSDTITLDTIGPNAPVVTGTTPTNNTQPTWTWTTGGNGGTGNYRYRLDDNDLTTGATETALLTFTPTSALSEASHTFYVQEKDAAGNWSTNGSKAILIDITAPTTMLTSKPSNPTNSTSASFGFSSDAGAIFECQIDGGAFSSCTSPKSYSGLASGLHTFAVKATDTANNIEVSPALYSWTIDTTAPDTTITAQPASLTNSTSASFSFTGSDNEAFGFSFECKLESGSFAVCTSPMDYTGLADGSHTFYVRTVDTAGNPDTTPASYTWAVDLTGPLTNILTQPAQITNSTDATFTFFAEAGATYECQLDNGGYTACLSGISYTSLPEGAHIFDVKAADTFGNLYPTPTSYTWTIDLTPPIGNSFINLPDTGQTKCYYEAWPYSEIPCVGNGQDGDYTINPLSYTDNGNGTVTDNNTGLMWQKQDNWNTYNWYQASGTYQDSYNPTIQNVCASLGTGGYTDWRLPSVKELQSIVDYGRYNPAIDPIFTNTASSYYWSSTTNAYSPNNAWVVYFGDGGVYHGTNKEVGYYMVRCVRAGNGSPDNLSLSDNGDGTISDTYTGLMWQQQEDGVSKIWDSALTSCNNSILGEYTDWRLPTVKELQRIVDYRRNYPAADPIFAGIQPVYYWSSTTNTTDPGAAWKVSYVVGAVAPDVKGQEAGDSLARCVRGGEHGIFGNVGILINNGAVSTVTTAVNLTLTAHDANGVAEMQFSNDGTNWSAPESYKAKKTWTLPSGDGTKIVYARFRDNAGNWSAVYSDTIVLDMAAPAITSATSTTADGYYKAGSAINITLNFSEELSSAGLTINLNSGGTASTGAFNNITSWSGTYTVGTGQTSADLSISSINGTITDLASSSTGNPTIPAGMNVADSKALVIDTTAPISAPSLPAGAYNVAKSVSLVCSDIAGSGCDKIYYCLGSSCTPTTEFTGTAVPVAATTDLRYYSTDNAGNAETVKTTSYMIENVAPSLAITYPGSNANIDRLMAIEGTASDAAPSSGLNRIEMQVFDGTYYLKYNTSTGVHTWSTTPQWIVADGLETWSHDTSNANWSDNYWYTITARAYDNAGNVLSTTSRFYLYTGNPAYSDLSLSLSSPAILNNSTLTLTGKLTRLPDVGVSLQGLPITFTVIAPDNTILPTITTDTYDQYGHYILANVGDNQSPVKFDQKGTYTIFADFNGNQMIAASQSNAAQVLVGASAGYAIIIEGRSTTNDGLASHNKTSNRIYERLKSRGFTDDNIWYFNFNTNQTGVDASPTKALIQAAIQGTGPFGLLTKMNSVPAPLYITLIDHGTSGNFIIGSETITPTELNSYLNTLEAGLNAAALLEKRIIINGSCYSGSFIPVLSKASSGGNAGRTIITSAATNEESYKGPNEPDGTRSGEFFVEELFKNLAEGASVKMAFEQATEKTRGYTRKGSGEIQPPYNDDAAQHPLLEDDGDGTGSNRLSDSDGDGVASEQHYLGVGVTNAAVNPAEFTKVADTQFLASTVSAALLWAEASDNAEVDYAWVEVRAPSKVLNSTGGSLQLDLDIPKSIMVYNSGTNHWEANYNGFSESGMYEVFFFTSRKVSGEVSSLKSSSVYKDKAGNSAPNVFSLVSPLNGTSQKTSLLLDWADTTDPDGDPVTYTVQILDTDSLNACTQTQLYKKEGLLYSLAAIGPEANLQDLATYCWKVLAIDKYGKTRTSTQTWKFNTDNTNGLPAFISGYITDAATGAGLKSAVITSSIGGSTQTFSDGYYILALPAGSTTLSASKAGYTDSATVSLSITSGASVIRNLSLTLIDVIAPNAPVVSGITPVFDTTPDWTWVSGGGGGNGTFRYQLDSTAGTWTGTTALAYTPVTALSLGVHTLYVQERDTAGNWSVSGSRAIKINAAPTIGTLTPNAVASPVGTVKTLAAIYRDLNGATDLKAVELLINAGMNGTNAIKLNYNRVVNKLYLYNDAGTATVGSCIPGVAGTLQNTQGVLDCEATTVVSSGNDLTVNWRITPKTGIMGYRNMFLKATDSSNAAVTWTQKGTWTITSANNVAPAVVSLSPATLSSSTGSAQLLTAVYRDQDGVADLKAVQLLINGSLTLVNGIRGSYSKSVNKLYLYNDVGTATVGSCTPGVAGTIQNTQGILDCGATTVTYSGTDMTVRWALKAKSGFEGAKKAYLKVTDNSNAATGWIQKGTWTITAAAPAPQAEGQAYSVITYGVKDSLTYVEMKEETVSSNIEAGEIEVITEPTAETGTGSVSIAVRKSAVSITAEDLKGTYSMAEHAGTVTSLTEYAFDGAGTVKITEKAASDKALAPSVTTTYAVTPDGGLSIGRLKGQVTEDGKVIVLATGNPEEAAALVIGAKKGSATDLSGSYEGAEVSDNSASTGISRVSADGLTLGAGSIMSEDGRVVIQADTDKADAARKVGVRILIRRK